MEAQETTNSFARTFAVLACITLLTGTANDQQPVRVRTGPDTRTRFLLGRIDGPFA